MKPLNPFHLAFPVDDLDAARAFYAGVLGCEEGRSSALWIDFNLCGHQIVAHLSNAPRPAIHNPVDGHDVPVPHFGVIMNWDDFHQLAARVAEAGVEFVIEPCIRFRGQPGEQATMFFRDPAGNALEFKSFRDFGQIFRALMVTLLVHASSEGASYKTLFERSAPELHVFATPEPFDPGSIDYFAGWNPPQGLLGALPRLKAVFALGAGVDALLARNDLPAHVPVVRLLDGGMAEQMLEYALYGVLTWQRHMDDYAAQQAHATWQRQALHTRAEVRVGVLGLGRMGSVVAGGLARMGYDVWGWSRSQHALERVHCTSGEDGLRALLERSDVLVNVLPSTPDTRGLLDHAALARLPRGSYLVSCSRGDQVDEAALLALLNDGHLDGALLDVFAQEPLPADHPLWRHPRVRITPHVAAITVPGPAVEQIVASIRTIEAGGNPEGLVDRARGY